MPEVWQEIATLLPPSERILGRMIDMSGVVMSWGRRMRQFLRYGVVPAGIFVILLLVTLILIPVVINVQRFVPEIESLVEERTGRPFSLGPDFNVTFFPSLSLSFSDMKLGNPPGFSSGEFIKIRTFEARVKVLPLLRKKIELSRFVVGGLSLNLEKNSSGQNNWNFHKKVPPAPRAQDPTPPIIAALAEHIAFTLLAVTDGQITWRDQERDTQYRVEDIMLVLNDFSSESPLTVDCRASINGRPVAVDGKVGPLKVQGVQGALPVDLSFSAVNILHGKVRGMLNEQTMAGNFAISVLPFSPREFFAAIDLPFPLSTNDPQVLTKFDMEMMVKGGKETIAIEKATGHIDDSKFDFSLEGKNLGHPEVGFSLDLDHVDLDRYLPPAPSAGKSPDEGDKTEEGVAGDRRSAREIVLAGALKIGELKVFGSTVTEVNISAQGKDGIFVISPAANTAYGGKVETLLSLDLQGNEPTLQATLAAQGLAAEPLLRDLFDWDKFHGTLAMEMEMHAAGDTFLAMQKNVIGKAKLDVQEGALVGIDLARPEATFGRSIGVNLDDRTEKTSRIEFAEAKGAATIKNGILYLEQTGLSSPVNWVQLSGTVDTILRQLDVQVESGFVATVKGKGGREEKVNQSSRYSITGPFAELTLNNLTNLSGTGTLGSKMSVKHLVEQKLPSPVEDDVKNLVGKDLVDPAVVAQRFGLQPDILRRSEVKKKIPVGSGKVSISALREEPALLP